MLASPRVVDPAAAGAAARSGTAGAAGTASGDDGSLGLASPRSSGGVAPNESGTGLEPVVEQGEEMDAYGMLFKSQREREIERERERFSS